MVELRATAARIAATGNHQGCLMVPYSWQRLATAISFAAQGAGLFAVRCPLRLGPTRSYQFSERIGRVLTEMQRKKLRNWPLLNPALLALNLPACPDCKIETLLQSSALFVCINCQRIVEDQLVVSHQVSIVPR
jgi:hypothetical protein